MKEIRHQSGMPTAADLAFEKSQEKQWSLRGNGGRIHEKPMQPNEVSDINKQADKIVDQRKWLQDNINA